MSSFPLRPVSACSGRKEFIETKIRRTVISGGRRPFRGHGGALKRARNIIASSRLLKASQIFRLTDYSRLLYSYNDLQYETRRKTSVPAGNRKRAARPPG